MSILTCIIIAIIASAISIVLVGGFQWVAQTRFEATRAKRNKAEAEEAEAAAEEAEAAAEEAEAAAEEAEAAAEEARAEEARAEKEAYQEYIGTCSVLFSRLQRLGSSVGLSVEEQYMGCVHSGEFDLDRLYAKLMEIEAAWLEKRTNRIDFDGVSRLVVWVNAATSSQVRLKAATNLRVEGENSFLVG